MGASPIGLWSSSTYTGGWGCGGVPNRPMVVQHIIQAGGGVGASPKAKNCRRAYRDKIKSDPEKYKEHKQREKERCQRRKAENKIKSIGNMTEREKRTKRKFWRENNRKRAAQAAIAATVDINGAAALNAPPPLRQLRRIKGGLLRIQQVPCGSGDLASSRSTSRQQARGRKIE